MLLLRLDGEENFRNYGDGAKNVRLSNSNIDSLSGLGKVLTNLQKHKIIISMSSLTWLDLSFNNITELGTDGAISNLSGLRSDMKY